MRPALIFIATLATTLPALAQNAANGEQLFTTPAVSGKLSCSANACHGKLTSPQNRILNGLQAGTIKAATGRVAQMRFLEGLLGDAQFNDVSAYLAGKLGGTPTYLQVVAMPVAALAPANLSFGARDLLSTSPTQTVTVSNAASASAALVLGAITTTSGSDFSVAGGSCKSGDSLPVGSSCSVLLSFTPSALGTRSAQLSVVHNGAAGVSTLALTGTGTGTSPVITLAPPALSFSQTLGSGSDPLRVLIGNTGTGPLRLSALRVSGANAAEFSVADGAGCSASTTLASGESCGVDLRFTPAAQAARSATLVVEHNALGGSSSVVLSGWGNTTPQPGVMLDTNRLDLGSQVVASPGTPRSLTLSNNGQAELRFTAIGVRGSQASEFSAAGSCAVGVPVAAKGSCTIAVSLTPADLGPRSATLEVASNAPAGTVSITLAGLGVPVPAPLVGLSQAALGFGTVALGGASAARTIVLSNPGNAALQLAGLRTSSTDFGLTHDCPASLAAGGICSLSVVFTPSSANVSEVLVITSNAASSPNNIVLTGLGTNTPLAVLDWAEGGAPIAFGNAAVGAATPQVTRTLVNRGPGSASLTTLAITGSDAGSFVLGGGSCSAGLSLAANASCTLALRFAPAAAGARSAVLQVGTSASNPPELPLSGTGAGVAVAQLPLAAEPQALDYRASIVTTGTRSQPLQVRIVNDGMSASTLAAATTSAGFMLEGAAGADACPGVPWTLAPGASCSVAVVFAPATGGPGSGTLRIVTSAGQTTEVALSATANTVMTNEGASGDAGGGSLSPHWLALLALAVAGVVAGRRRDDSTTSKPTP